ncbi:MAG TPA: hypothetical protein VIJ65_07235 [Acidobacteriaceae bacterium]
MSKAIRKLLLMGSVAILCVSSYARQNKLPEVTKVPTSSIPDGEAHFTPEQLQEYYLVYKNPDVRYLRTLFDDYLKGHGKEDEAKLLRPWSSEYYRSKFVVLSRDQDPFGGTLITLIFEDRPDRVFIAWVYPEGGTRKIKLRAFDPGKFNDEDLRRIRIRYRAILSDKEHAM